MADKKSAYDLVMKRARKRVADMDKVDGSSVADGPVDGALRTIMSALECAINTGDWGTAGDAQVMLSQLELRLRPEHQKANGFYLMEK